MPELVTVFRFAMAERLTIGTPSDDATVKLSLIIAALIAAVPAVAHAQGLAALDPARLDPSVTAVVTGGRWEIGSRRGMFRLLVSNAGWEQISGRFVVQWLEEQPERRRIVLQSSRDVEAIPTESWALDAPHLELQNRRWYAVVTGTTDGGRIRRTWRFELASPGVVREQRR